MRDRFNAELARLNQKMIEMGAICKDMIVLAMESLGDGGTDRAKEITVLGHEVDQMEREIESICLRLLLKQQPVAGDFRQISAALKMITDLERIGDQTEDIAEMILHLGGRTDAALADFRPMAEAACKMVTNSMDAYVKKDIALAKAVISYDDVVDGCFRRMKETLINRIACNAADGEYALDLLMIAKYLERIGDHAENVAEWVLFSVTGLHRGE